MSLQDKVFTTPSTIKDDKNYLKDYINDRGFNYDTNCLEVFISKNSDFLRQYVRRIGDYNTVEAKNPRYREPTTIKYRNYNQYCPENWRQSGGGCYAPSSYNGPCNAGRWKTGRRCQRYFWWKWCYNYSYWQQPSYFYGYSPNDKENWARQCRSNWPEVSKYLPGKWICNYGSSIGTDYALGRIMYIGKANNYLEAAKMVLLRNFRGARYFIIVNNHVYVAEDGGSQVFTSKGTYQQNCTENNNQKAVLYELSTDLFTLLEKCKTVNDNLNSANNTVNSMVGSSFDLYNQRVKQLDENVVEGYTNWEKQNQKNTYTGATKSIEKNLNEIVTNLSENYNKKVNLYNLQSDIINRHDAVVERNQSKLNAQMNTMIELQDQIAVKNRVAELNEEMLKKQITNKKLLNGFFVLLPFLVIPFLLIAFKTTSPLVGLGIGGLMILAYIIYAIVIINKNKIKKFVKPTMKQLSKYEKAIKDYYEKEKDKIGKNLSDYVYGNCNCPPEEMGEGQEGEEGSDMNFKGIFLLDSNGPYYYFDGSAPPQQIQPRPTGSIEFDLNGLRFKWPRDISEKLGEIFEKNPIKGYFFLLWLDILDKKGISVDDPRFNKKLDVVDFETSGSTPMPYWENIKLPMVTNLQQNISYVCQSYNSRRKKIGQDAGSYLVDMWNYVYGDRVPNNIYQTWLTKINNTISKKGDVAKVYRDYFNYIIQLPEFNEKYGDFSNFIKTKVEDFVKVLNSNVALSQPNVERLW